MATMLRSASCVASNSGRTAPLVSRGPDILTRRCVAVRSIPVHKEFVKDIMNTDSVITCGPEDSIDTALELLVHHRITGLPVLDERGVVVGVVSDFDLLALDTFGSTNSADFFPEAEQTWQAFIQVRKVLAKGTGKRVEDVMTKHPVTVRPNTNINDATSILLKKKIRRLPVVDGEGHLLGLISRRDIIKSALEARKMSSSSGSSIANGSPSLMGC